MANTSTPEVCYQWNLKHTHARAVVLFAQNVRHIHTHTLAEKITAQYLRGTRRRSIHKSCLIGSAWSGVCVCVCVGLHAHAGPHSLKGQSPFVFGIKRRRRSRALRFVRVALVCFFFSCGCFSRFSAGFMVGCVCVLSLFGSAPN